MTNREYENKVSDDEIISSLETIATTRNCDECKIRNCKWGDCDCSQITANTALDIINRQKAEIERLQKEVNLVSLKQIEISSNIEKKIKSEAYKEFAEELKNTLRNIPFLDVFFIINNLLKEMVGNE